jgi:hypothetical protein
MEFNLYSKAYHLMSDRERHVFNMTTKPRSIVLLTIEPDYERKLNFLGGYPHIDEVEFEEEFGCLTSDFVYEHYGIRRPTKEEYAWWTDERIDELLSTIISVKKLQNKFKKDFVDLSIQLIDLN